MRSHCWSWEGRIAVTATWSGTAPRLALILNGPERPELANPAAYYARSDGTSPLSLTYQVSAEDVARGRRFQVSLVNFSGGEAWGGIDMETPRTFVFDYAKVARLIARPTPMVLAHTPGSVVRFKSQAEVCAEAVQGTIAWNYRGDTSWNPANVQRLCEGTNRGEEPARCFRQVMHGGVDWGGGTRWEWEKAVDLCEGTSDAARTVGCFVSAVRGGRRWPDAIQACQARWSGARPGGCEVSE